MRYQGNSGQMGSEATWWGISISLAAVNAISRYYRTHPPETALILLTRTPIDSSPVSNLRSSASSVSKTSASKWLRVLDVVLGRRGTILVVKHDYMVV
jgi:hypothetical protein